MTTYNNNYEERSDRKTRIKSQRERKRHTHEESLEPKASKQAARQTERGDHTHTTHT